MTPYTAEENKDEATVLPLRKPGGFSLDKFKSTKPPTSGGVETLQAGLPHGSISQAKDFVRLHQNEDEYWSCELCFVSVPVKGQKRETLHLIDEELALRFLPSGRIKRMRLALASKPFDVFFLCEVPSQNMDNPWNESALEACEMAKHRWVTATSRKAEGIEGYKIDVARDAEAFSLPKWPTASLSELIETSLAGRMIDHAEHPALLRLIGAKQSLE
jgi:hypothetical protein